SLLEGARLFSEADRRGGERRGHRGGNDDAPALRSGVGGFVGTLPASVRQPRPLSRRRIEPSFAENARSSASVGGAPVGRVVRRGGGARDGLRERGGFAGRARKGHCATHRASARASSGG